MSGVLQAVFQNQRSFGTVPGAPTIGVATISGTTASVSFTAPVSDGGSVITSYTATSTPGGITGVLYQAGSGTVTVSGLTAGTTYTFKVKATNAIGTGPESAASNSVTAQVVGQVAYTTAGTYCWVAPAGVTKVSIVAVSGGGGSGYGFNYCCCGSRVYVSAPGGGGGGLGYKNNVSVSPGGSYQIVVGAGGSLSAPGGSTNVNSIFNGAVVGGGTGAGGSTGGARGYAYGCWTQSYSGGLGGSGISGSSHIPGGGGGGAAGYSGLGGCGGRA